MKKYRYDKISTYIKLNKREVILLSITGLFFDGLMCLVPIFQGRVIDTFKAQESYHKIFTITSLFFIFVLFIQVNRYFKRYFVRKFSNNMILQMRSVSFDNLLHDDISEFSKTTKGDIMNKNLSDIKDSAEGIRKVLTEVFDSIILLLGYMITMFILDFKLTLMVLIFVLISIFLAQAMKRRVHQTTVEYKQYFSHSKDVTLNSIHNEVYYRGLGVSDNYYAEYKHTMDKLETKSIKSMVFKGSLEPMYGIVAIIGIFFVIYFSGKNMIQGIWLLGTFTAYLQTFILVSRKASKIGKVFNAYQNGKVSWNRCVDYLRTPSNSKTIETIGNNYLDVRDLTFGFSKEFEINQISFSLNAKEKLGICGMVHSGKSTLGAALSGLYDYEGSIRLSGIELKEVKDDYIDCFIAYSPSVSQIFNDTLKYNIGFDYDIDISDAIGDSLLVNDIGTFSKGENEVMSHSLVNISGGQQKRVQISRCLFSKSKLIILDDPFNAIDIVMSEKIIDNIIRRNDDSIYVIINNQKEILIKMNKIIFLKDNSYLIGTYHELLKDPDFCQLMGGNI